MRIRCEAGAGLCFAPYRSFGRTVHGYEEVVLWVLRTRVISFMKSAQLATAQALACARLWPFLEVTRMGKWSDPRVLVAVSQEQAHRCDTRAISMCMSWTGSRAGEGGAARVGHEHPTGGGGIQKTSSPADGARAGPGWLVGVGISTHHGARA